MQKKSESLLKNVFPFLMGTVFIALFFLIAIYYFPQMPSLGESPKNENVLSVFNFKNATEKQIETFALNDGAPLFFYTNFNYGNVEFNLPNMRPMSLQKKEENTRKSLEHFEENIFKKVELSSPNMISPEHLVYNAFGRDFNTLPRKEISNVSLMEPNNAQKVFFNVMSFDTGKIVYKEELKFEINTKGILWSPVEMTMVVSSEGAPSAPLITAQSGLEFLDEAFEDFILKNSNSLNLKAGFYKLIFAP